MAAIPVFGKALRELLRNDPLRMAGATAFFTTFALPPILVILIQSLKLIFDPRVIRAELFKNLSGIIGAEAVQQIVDVLRGFRRLAQDWYITIGGFLFLLFVATTLFKVIKGSINQLWNIRPVKRISFAKNMMARIQSVAIILVAGLLFALGIMAEGVQALIGNSLHKVSPLLSVYFNTVLNYVVSIIVVMLWFVMLFRYLPDGRPTWRVAFTGALVTACLFTIGKFILHLMLSYSSLNNLYGTSASIILLLLFVFYTSLILYFGASFTRMWGEYKAEPIEPHSYAGRYKVTESEDWNEPSWE